MATTNELTLSTRIVTDYRPEQASQAVQLDRTANGQIALEDMDQDGRVDIVTVGCAPSTVRVNETFRLETEVKR